MAGESQQVPTTKPDPSVLTTEALDKAIANLEQLAEARLKSLRRELKLVARQLDERYATQVKAVDAALTAQQTAMQTAFTAADKAVDKAREADQKAVETALEAAEKAVVHRQAQLDKEFHEHLEQVRHENQLAFVNADKAVMAALASQEKAVGKAEAASEKRFEAVNEFRGQLADQASLFLPRTEYTANHQNLQDRVSDLTDRINRSEGKGAGYAALYGWGVGAVGIVLTVIVVANAIFSGRA